MTDGGCRNAAESLVVVQGSSTPQGGQNQPALGCPVAYVACGVAAGSRTKSRRRCSASPSVDVPCRLEREGEGAHLDRVLVYLQQIESACEESWRVGELVSCKYWEGRVRVCPFPGTEQVLVGFESLKLDATFTSSTIVIATSACDFVPWARRIQACCVGGV